MSGASRVSLLLWAKDGTRKECDAVRTHRTESKAWPVLLELGHIYVESGTGNIMVTAGGSDYLTEETFYS